MNNNTYSKFTPYKMLLYLFIIQLLIAFVGRSIAPLGMIIGEDLQLSMSQIGMFPAALFLGQSLVSMPAGILTDKIGSRKMILIIVLVLSGSFLIMSLSTSFIFILLLMTIAGLAYGSSHPTTNRGIIYWFDVERRGTAMGIKQMGVTFGSALAAFLLLPLAKSFGWQMSFISAAFVLLIVGFVIYILYEEPQLDDDENPHLKKSKSNGFHVLVDLLKHKALILITFSAMLLSGSQMILNTFIIIFAYERLGISIILAGVLLGIAEIGGSVGRVAWGVISDRLLNRNRVIVLLLISFLVAIVSITVIILPNGVSFYIVAVIIFIFGFSTSGFNGVWMNATTEIVGRKQSGTATGVSITFGSWGVILFPPIFGFIVDTTGSYTIAWMFVTMLMICSITSLLLVLMIQGKSMKVLKITN